VTLLTLQSPRDAPPRDAKTWRGQEEEEACLPDDEPPRVSTEKVAEETRAAPSRRELLYTERGGERTGEHLAAGEVEAWREDGRKEARRVIATAEIQALEQLESARASMASRGSGSEGAAAEARGDAAPKCHRTNIMACPMSVGQAEATGVRMPRRCAVPACLAFVPLTSL